MNEVITAIDQVLKLHYMPAVREQLRQEFRQDIERIVKETLDRCSYCRCQRAKCEHCGAAK